MLTTIGRQAIHFFNNQDIMTNAQSLAQAHTILSNIHSVPFLTTTGTIHEISFLSELSAAQCRNNPDGTIRKYGLVKMLSDPQEIADAWAATTKT